MVRLADRYAAWFLPLTLAVAGLAWLLERFRRPAVAVLVVATPCPLLLAAPVAIVSGLSRAARRGVLVRDGGALERLGRARTLLIDKTGTLTAGRPAVSEVAAAPGRAPPRCCGWPPRSTSSPRMCWPRRSSARRAAGAGAVVAGRGQGGTGAGCHRRGGRPPGARRPRDAVPDAVGACGGQPGRAGRRAWPGSGRRRPAGAVLLQDPLRHDAPRTLRRLRAAGIQRLLMLTGDRPEPAREVGKVLGLDDVRAGQPPASKVAGVRAERAGGHRDGRRRRQRRPRAGRRHVGVAMGARGSTASSEAADMVLTTDRVDRLADAVEIAVRARRIAVQSALAGWRCRWPRWRRGLRPAAACVGALLQEAIDVAVILNALRALGAARPGGRRRRRRRACSVASRRNMTTSTRCSRSCARQPTTWPYGRPARPSGRCTGRTRR